MPLTRREHQRAATGEEIKAVARKQMAEHGTAGVSLRQIARAMEMSAPSLYHYFENYDALITALIVDAFNDLADTLEQAADASADAEPQEQLLALAQAYRGWALQHPIDFQLIYGNPIPGYSAPRERTVPAVVRSYVTLAKVVGLAAEQHSEELVAALGERPASVEAHLAAMRAQYDYPVSPAVLYATVVLWTQMHGIITLELYHHLQPTVGDVDAFYQAQVRHTLQTLGFTR